MKDCRALLGLDGRRRPSPHDFQADWGAGGLSNPSFGL